MWRRLNKNFKKDVISVQTCYFTKTYTISDMGGWLFEQIIHIIPKLFHVFI